LSFSSHGIDFTFRKEEKNWKKSLFVNFIPEACHGYCNSTKESK